MILRRFFGISSALMVVVAAFVAQYDAQRAIYMTLTAILFHLWSIEE